MTNQVAKKPATHKNSVHEPLFHLTKRADLPNWKAWLIRGGAILGSFLFIVIVASIQFKQNPFTLLGDLFDGVFGTSRRVNALFRDVAILLIISLAVTPAFKMKFWNIGAEGQVLIAGLACAACMHNFGGKMSDGGLIVVSLIAALGAGIAWAVVPAIFKAFFNTNETLFTLMMNYVAIQLILYTIKAWYPTGSGSMAPLTHGVLPQVAGGDYLLSIIFAVIITIALFLYMRFSKHGYEVSVVGESVNTAKYIGINVKKVIIRTLILSGAMCAFAGFLLVSGINHMVSSNTAGGRGFTAVMVSWLAQFNPLAMALMSFIVVFSSKGMIRVMETVGITNNYFADVLVAVMFFIIIAFEFFIRYKVMFRKKEGAVEKKSKKAKAETAGDESVASESLEDSSEPSADAIADSSEVLEKVSDNDADAIESEDGENVENDVNSVNSSDLDEKIVEEGGQE